MTIEDETQTLGPGDVVVVNRGLHHALYSESGVTFMEALAPVPLDHVPDRDARPRARPRRRRHARRALRCRSCESSCSSAGSPRSWNRG